MLLEDLLSLPVGTRVFGEIAVPTTVRGVVASHENGTHFIRWEHGSSTIPLGKNARADEYIAAHTELLPSCQQRVVYPRRTAGTCKDNGRSRVGNYFAEDRATVLDEDAVEVSHG